MNIAVVEDMKQLQIHLMDLLECYEQEKACPMKRVCFDNGTDFLQSLSETVYDIVFMDIYIGEPNGIETAMELRKVNRDCILIFTTSSPDHMPNAFSARAFDYILKPVQKERLYTVLSDAIARLPQAEPSIEITVGKQVIPLLFSQIRAVTSDSQYCWVMADEDYRCRVSFASIEKELQEDTRFLNINRGILVNLDFVVDMENHNCKLQDGSNYPINLRKYKSHRQRLLTHRFDRMSAGGVSATDVAR